jgi:hypothetical protein
VKIAQVAPLYESVPPRAYGGTERVYTRHRRRLSSSSAGDSAGVFRPRQFLTQIMARAHTRP